MLSLSSIQSELASFPYTEVVPIPNKPKNVRKNNFDGRPVKNLPPYSRSSIA